MPTENAVNLHTCTAPVFHCGGPVYCRCALRNSSTAGNQCDNMLNREVTMAVAESKRSYESCSVRSQIRIVGEVS